MCRLCQKNKKAMKSFDFTAFSGAMEGTRTKRKKLSDHLKCKLIYTFKSKSTKYEIKKLNNVRKAFIPII